MDATFSIEPIDLSGDGACFSPCRRYRPLLWRRWAANKPLLNLVMLNPSTADASRSDATIARCIRRARLLDFGGLLVTNLFSACATDPRQLARLTDPVGPGNDGVILRTAHGASMVLCAWGVHGRLANRAVQVEAMLRAEGHPLYMLKLTARGFPQHPLYLPYDMDPLPWVRGNILKPCPTHRPPVAHLHLQA